LSRSKRWLIPASAAAILLALIAFLALVGSGSRVTVILTNRGSTGIDEVQLDGRAGGWELTSLAPGETRTVTLPRRGLSSLAVRYRVGGDVVQFPRVTFSTDAVCVSKIDIVASRPGNSVMVEDNRFHKNIAWLRTLAAGQGVHPAWIPCPCD